MSMPDLGGTVVVLGNHLGIHHDDSDVRWGRRSSSTWDGTILQLPKSVSTFHRACRLLLKEYTMYCTYSNNPTQIELLNDDIELTPYYLSEADCLSAWNTNEFTYQDNKISLQETGITPILIGADITKDGFCSSSKSKSKVIRGRFEKEWADVQEESTLSGQDVTRTVDGKLLTWTATGQSSRTVDGLVVLSNAPRTHSCHWEILFVVLLLL